MRLRVVQLGLALMWIAGINVRAAEGTVKFNLPAMELCDAVTEFYHQSNVPIIFVPLGAECHLRTRSVLGEFQPRDALKRMLADTAVAFRQAADGTLIITASKVTATPMPHLAKVLNFDEGDPQKVSEVLVTGSLLRGDDGANLSVPLTNLTRKELLGAGYATVQDALYPLPLISLNAPREDNLGGGNYQFGAGINLRGLGVGATLVLVDGRRQPESGLNGDFVDVSNIPLSAVERVEILPDGASAIYGSDAIAGVVNIIMLDDIKGAETQARFGGTPNGRDEAMVSQLVGTHWDTGRVVVAYQYLTATALAAAEVPYAANSDKRSFGGADYRSFYSNPGNILDPLTLLPAYGIPSGQNGTALTANSLSRVLNLTNQFTDYQIFPQRTSHYLYATLSQEIGGGVDLFADGRFTLRDAVAAKSASEASLSVPSSNAFNRLGDTTVVAYDFLRDLGPNTFSAETRDYMGTVGLTFRMGLGWLATWSGSFGRDTMVSYESNVPDSLGLGTALGSPNRSSAFNPFGDGSNTSPATLAAIQGEVVSSAVSGIETVSLIADGPVLDMPAGSVLLAMGVEGRQETLRHDVPAVLSASEQPVTQRYSREIRSAFAELALPLLGNPDHPRAAPRLEAIWAGRFEDYTDFGKAFSPSALLRWLPIHSLRLRASWTRSFRAPTLDDLYDSSLNASGFAVLDDPRSPTGRSTVLAVQGSNPSLRAETATTWTGGLDAELPTVPDLKLSLTYYAIDYEGRIINPALDPPADILGQSEWAPFILRNPSAVMVNAICSRADFLGSRAACLISSPAAIVDLRLANLGSTQTSGVDMNVHEELDSSAGRFGFGLVGSRIFHFDQAGTSASPSLDLLNTLGNPLGLRMRATATWSQHTPNGFAAEAAVNHTGRYRNPGSALLPNIASSTTFDFRLHYRAPCCNGWWSETDLVLNVVNVFDRSPPFVDDLYGYDVANAQPLGRLVSLYLGKRW